MLGRKTIFSSPTQEIALWEAIIWNIPAIALNVVMIFLILRDSKLPFKNDDGLMLFEHSKD